MITRYITFPYRVRTPRPKPIMLAISYMTLPDRARTSIVIEMVLEMIITKYVTFPDRVRTPRPNPIMLTIIIKSYITLNNQSSGNTKTKANNAGHKLYYLAVTR